MGKFVKGQSGNPGGRPKEHGELRDLAPAKTAEALQTLIACLRSKNDRTRVAAAEAILDRGWGPPTQAIAASVEGMGLVLNINTKLPKSEDADNGRV